VTFRGLGRLSLIVPVLARQLDDPLGELVLIGGALLALWSLRHYLFSETIV
jgi:hypothetical protein